MSRNLEGIEFQKLAESQLAFIKEVEMTFYESFEMIIVINGQGYKICCKSVEEW